MHVKQMKSVIEKQKINPFFRASIWYVVGNGIGQGMIILGTFIFTRLMNQSSYGMYSAYYSVVSIFATLVGANLFVGLNNGYIDYAHRIHNFRASVLILSSFVFLIFSGMIILFRFILGLYVPLFMTVFALVHAYAFFVVNYYINSLNMENRYREKTALFILPNMLQVVFSVIFMIFCNKEYELQARIAGSTGGVFICAAFSYFSIIRGEKNFLNKEFWKYSLGISVPSILSSVSYMLMQNCDNIMITHFYGSDETAVYALVYNIGYILYAVLQAANGVWQAWLYRALNSGNVANVKKAQKWYLFLLGQMSFGLYMISPEIIKILAPSSYWNFYYITPFVTGSCFMAMYSFYTTLGTFYKKTGKVAACVFASGVTNIILNALLIPRFGGVAAAYTSAFSYFLLFLLSRKLGNALKKGLFSDWYFGVFIGSIIGGGILFLIIYPYIIARYLCYMGLLVCSCIYMFYRKDEILSLLKG